MAGGIGAGPRPGWDRYGAGVAAYRLMAERRWRILEAVHPPGDRVPIFIRTPEQFVEWLALRLRPAELRAYFRDLEAVARDTCDLELLRFARRYLGQAPKLRRG